MTFHRVLVQQMSKNKANGIGREILHDNETNNRFPIDIQR